jgi:hypothetical protein
VCVGVKNDYKLYCYKITLEEISMDKRERERERESQTSISRKLILTSSQYLT